jgi:hypothetical protein
MSNIKFHVDNIADYTLTLATSEASGYEKEFMLDRRLATYWKATTGGTQDIEIDLGADTAVDYILIYADLDIDDTVTVYYDDNAGYSSPIQADSEVITVTGWQVVKLSFTEVSADDRYWRIRIVPDAAAPSCATVFIGSEYEITIRFNYGCILEEKNYSGVKVVNSYGGQRGASRQSEPRNIWKFFYETLDATNKGKLDSILALTNGAQYPFYYLDEDSNYHYVRWITAGLNAVERFDQLYDTGEILLEQELGSPV